MIGIAIGVVAIAFLALLVLAAVFRARERGEPPAADPRRDCPDRRRRPLAGGDPRRDYGDPRPGARRFLHDRRDREQRYAPRRGPRQRPRRRPNRGRAARAATEAAGRNGERRLRGPAGAALLRAGLRSRYAGGGGGRGGLRVPAPPRRSLRGDGRAASAGKADRHAEHRGQSLRPALPRRRCPLRQHPRRAGGAGPRQRRALLRPRADRARTCRDRRDPPARPAAAAAAAHSGLVRCRDVSAGGRRERDRRRLLRRLSHRRRLDGGDRRRHRPRRQGRLGDRARALHPAHGGGAHRRPSRRPGNPQPRAAGAPRRHPVQRRGAGDRGRLVAAGARGRGRPPGAAARRRRLGDRGDCLGAGAGRLPRRCLGGRAHRGETGPATGRGHGRGHRRGRKRGSLRRAAAARRTGGRRQPRDRRSEARGGAARLHRRQPRRRRGDRRHRSGLARGGAGAHGGSASWSSDSSRPSTAATPRRSPLSATRDWSSSRSALPR